METIPATPPGSRKTHVIQSATSQEALSELVREITPPDGTLTGVTYLGVKVDGRKSELQAVGFDGCDESKLIICPAGIGDDSNLVQDTADMLELLGVGDSDYFLPRLQDMPLNGTFRQGLD